MTAAVGSTVPGTRKRELYLDALRTAAIVRVVTYHTFGGAWLSWAFPAMGVMFALAGGLMVNSLDRQDPSTVIRNRVRRLLPALWLFGAVMVPLMIWAGGKMSSWTDSGTGEPVPLWHIVFWFVPLLDPPGNTFGENATVVLWYLRTYLWLVLLSPVLLTAFRRAPVPTLIAPLGLLVAQAFGFLPTGDDGPIWALVSDLGIFAPCWMLGFAHRTGALKRLPNVALGLFVVVAAAGAVAWVVAHPSDSYDLNGIPIAQSLWSIAVILPLLRFAPDASWIGRTPVLGRFVALVNNRAVTIYLWHNILIDLAFFSGERLEEVGGVWESGISTNPFWAYGTVWVLIAVAVMVFGWAEDLAARRRPRLWPVGPSAGEVREAQTASESSPPDPVPVGATVPTMDGPYVPTMDGPRVPTMDRPRVPTMDRPRVPTMDGTHAPTRSEPYAPAGPVRGEPRVPAMDATSAQARRGPYPPTMDGPARNPQYAPGPPRRGPGAGGPPPRGFGAPGPRRRSPNGPPPPDAATPHFGAPDAATPHFGHQDPRRVPAQRGQTGPHGARPQGSGAPYASPPRPGRAHADGSYPGDARTGGAPGAAPEDELGQRRGRHRPE
ncbi:acyltransferase family protein [Cryptosporangium sp. NPDC048952]|uniref:acyltransferase family protein n=1 Tax=Cryptosporangium sp. NPDC048952 TaxID=3363961 RepID=UPI003712DE2C